MVGSAWKPSPDVTDSQPASEELLLDPGRWDISIQYASTQPMHLTSDSGLAADLEPNLLFRGPAPFYPVGEIEVERRGLVSFKVTVDPPPAFGRLLGTETRAYLQSIAATPVPARKTIPDSRTCGTYVDWYAPAPDAPEALIDRVEAPTPHEVVED